MSRLIVSALALSGGLAWSLTAHADAASDIEQARQFYAQGKAQYEAKDYLGALDDFEHSYALTRSTALLFDIAQAHRLAGSGHCAASRRYYRSYLELEPEAENKREVDERLAEIAGCADAEEQAAAADAKRAAAAATQPNASPATSANTAAPLNPPSHSTPVVAVLTTGVGAALLVTGAVLYFRARQRFHEAERTCPCPEGSFSDWQKLTNLSYGLMAVGGAGVVVGGTYWAISVSRDGARGSSAFLAVDGRF